MTSLVIASLACLALPALATSDLDRKASSSLEAIDSAAEKGQISKEQESLYKLYLATGSDKLPSEFTPDGEALRCGTRLLMEVRDQLDELSEDAQREYDNATSRPTGLDGVLDTDHFRIHYATGGNNAVAGWPDAAYLEGVASAAEAAWHTLHVEQQWDLPPSDGDMGGDDGRTDIYLVDLGSGLYGYTVAEDEVEDARPNNRTAYFVVDNDYYGFGYSRSQDPMRVTVAHEYHHVVQMGYTTENRWWMENLSTFVEDEVFDELDDNYNYLSCFTSRPARRLDLVDGCHEYGAFLWPTFIKENWSHDIVRQIQECASDRNLIACFDDILTRNGSTFAEAFADFATWNFYTSFRDDGNHYVEGGAYRNVVGYGDVINSYPRVGIHPSASWRPERTGTSVIRFTPQAYSGDNLLSLVFRGPACIQRAILFQKMRDSDTVIEHHMNLNALGDGTLSVLDWDKTEYAHLYAVLPWGCGEGAFDYTIDVDTDTQVTSVPDNPALFTRRVELDQNVPNPFGQSTKIRYGLKEAGPVQLDIYDASGRRVRALVKASQPAGAFDVSWDGRDDAGREVSPGVYFYRVQSGSDALMKKLIIIDD